MASEAAARIAGGARTREGKVAGVRLLRAVAKTVPSARETGETRAFPILPSIAALWLAVARDRHMQAQVVGVMVEVLDAADLRSDQQSLSLIVEQVVSEVLAEGVATPSAPSMVLLEATAELWFKLLHAVPALTGSSSHPAPCTLHPAPCTLHPAPCTLHPAP